MNLPKFVYDIIATKYNKTECKLIDSNWHDFAQVSFGDSSKAKILKTAAMVLHCAKEVAANQQALIDQDERDNADYIPQSEYARRIINASIDNNEMGQVQSIKKMLGI